MKVGDEDAREGEGLPPPRSVVEFVPEVAANASTKSSKQRSEVLQF